MNKTFLIDTLERAVKTFLQTAIAAAGLQFIASGLGANIFDGSGWQKVGVAALTAGVAAVFSLLTSVASAAKTGTASASAEVAETGVVKSEGTVQLVDGKQVAGVLPTSAAVGSYTPEHSTDSGVTAVDYDPKHDTPEPVEKSAY